MSVATENDTIDGIGTDIRVGTMSTSSSWILATAGEVTRMPSRQQVQRGAAKEQSAQLQQEGLIVSCLV